jgi:hypothetical protein
LRWRADNFLVRPAHDLEPVFIDLLPRLRACEDGGGPLFDPGERIVANARRFAGSPADRARFARSVEARSVNPAVLPVPAGASKAALFAGDALYAAGFAAPARDGHYLPPPDWPSCALFQPVGRAWVRPGDLLVLGAHLEVIMAVFGDRSAVLTLGARQEGLIEDRIFGERLLRAGRRADHFVHAGQTLHLLRVAVQTS